MKKIWENVMVIVRLLMLPMLIIMNFMYWGACDTIDAQQSVIISLNNEAEDLLELSVNAMALVDMYKESDSTKDSIIELQQQAITSLELQLKYHVDWDSRE